MERWAAATSPNPIPTATRCSSPPPAAVTVSPHIQANMPFDTFRDFAPVALVTKVTEVLVVSPKLGVKTVKDLVALAKQKPGAVTFASTGVGSPPHLAQIFAGERREREIFARALSRRGAGADRSARRPGASGFARHAGGDLAKSRPAHYCRSE